MSLLASETKSIYFGIGRRKASVAKVILVPGTGAIVVNHRQGEKYLQYNPISPIHPHTFDKYVQH